MQNPNIPHAEKATTDSCDELIKQAAELLRGVRQLFELQNKSHYVLNLLEEEQDANGGGDGQCLNEEIGYWFDNLAAMHSTEEPGE